MSRRTAKKEKERLDRLEINIKKCIELVNDICVHKIKTSIDENNLKVFNNKLSTIQEQIKENDKCWMDYLKQECRKSFINGMLAGAWALVLTLIVVSLLI